MDGKRYLVTARHVVQGIGESDSVAILFQGQWHSLRVRLVGHGEGDVDVSVLAPDVLFGVDYELKLWAGGLRIPETVYFLGFPYGMSVDVGELNEGNPMALVKSAAISALYMPEGRFLLDGHNNPGFSGGPVVRDVQVASPQTVIGVVSGYRRESPRVRDLQGNEGPYTYETNTGSVVVWSIARATDLIAANPIGISADPDDAVHAETQPTNEET